MKKLIATVLIATTASCAWFKSEAKTAETALIDCASAEKTIALQGTDVIMLAISVAGEFAMAVMNGTVEQTLTGLYTKYGEPFVACVLHNLAPSATGSASTGEEDPVSAAARQTIATKGWQFK